MLSSNSREAVLLIATSCYQVGPHSLCTRLQQPPSSERKATSSFFAFVAEDSPSETAQGLSSFHIWWVRIDAGFKTLDASMRIHEKRSNRFMHHLCFSDLATDMISELLKSHLLSMDPQPFHWLRTNDIPESACLIVMYFVHGCKNIGSNVPIKPHALAAIMGEMGSFWPGAARKGRGQGPG